MACRRTVAHDQFNAMAPRDGIIRFWFRSSFRQERIMRGPNDFWLSYNQLIEAYKAEGTTTDARIESIVDQFRRMPESVRQHPQSVRQHIVADMDEFLSVMAELRISVTAEGDGAPARLKKRGERAH
jgi:hypothetical protein